MTFVWDTHCRVYCVASYDTAVILSQYFNVEQSNAKAV